MNSKNLLRHYIRTILREAIETDVATHVFVMKSPYTPEGWRWDHIGFVLQDGSLKDMSGHRYDEEKMIPLPPIKYKLKDVDKIFEMPSDDKQELIKLKKYAEKRLPEKVVIKVPSDIPANAVNCVTYVKEVLASIGIETSDSLRPDEVFESML